MDFIRVKETLPKEHLFRLHDLVSGMNGFPWYFLSEDVAIDTTGYKFGGQELLEIPDREKACGFTHLLLDQGGIESPYLPYFYGLLDTVKSLFGVPIEVFRLRLALQLNNGIDHIMHLIQIVRRIIMLVYFISMTQVVRLYSLISLMKCIMVQLRSDG